MIRTRRYLWLPLLLVASSVLHAADWPQFRGPNRDGVSAETGLLRQWPEKGPEVSWRTDLGEGFSAMSVVEGRIYTLAGRESDELLLALDAATGKPIWQTRVGAKWVDRWGNGPRSTPTVDETRVYALGSKGDLIAAARKDGKRCCGARACKASTGSSPRAGAYRPPRWSRASYCWSMSAARTDRASSPSTGRVERRSGERWTTAPATRLRSSSPLSTCARFCSSPTPGWSPCHPRTARCCGATPGKRATTSTPRPRSSSARTGCSFPPVTMSGRRC